MKILIINNNKHTHLGGVEQFSRELINFLIKEGHEVKEFFMNKITMERSPEIISRKFESINVSGLSDAYFFKAKKMINKVIGSYDIVINNSVEASWKGVLNSEKVIYVQHADYSQYVIKNMSMTEKTKLFLDSKILRLKSYKNVINSAKNVLLYDEICNHSGRLAFYSHLPVASDIENKRHSQASGKITWIGRFTKQKGIKYLCKTNNSIDVYGAGSLISKIKKNKNLKYKGYLDRKDINKVLDETSFGIVTSITEGCCLMIAEYMKKGVPVIVFDTFDYAKYYQKSGGVFLVNNMAEMDKKIRELKKMSQSNYEILSDSVREFISNNMNYYKWEENMRIIIRSIYEKTFDNSLNV